MGLVVAADAGRYVTNHATRLPATADRSPQYEDIAESMMCLNHDMHQAELMRRLVLNEICDDFENIDQTILRHVAKSSARFGLTMGRNDVIEVLSSLVADGFAKAYDLSGAVADPFSGELLAMPDLEVIEENFTTYFYVTDAGLNFHRSDDTWWPHEDDNDLS